jgi:hypothetical protein
MPNHAALADRAVFAGGRRAATGGRQRHREECWIGYGIGLAFDRGAASLGRRQIGGQSLNRAHPNRRATATGTCGQRANPANTLTHGDQLRRIRHPWRSAQLGPTALHPQPPMFAILEFVPIGLVDPSSHRQTRWPPSIYVDG